MHVLYAADTADEAIYGKEDWSDLTGKDSNVYLEWPLGGEEPTVADGPPRTPRPTEQQFWESLGGSLDASSLPLSWPCEWPRGEWRLDTRGTVSDLEGRPVRNPQGAVEAVRRVRSDGGRFRVSRQHRFLVVPDPEAGENGAWLVGRLDEPFALFDQLAPSGADESGVEELAPGDPYRGPLDRDGGTYQIRQKAGGLIERRAGRIKEFASRENLGSDPRAANTEILLQAWRQLAEGGLKFFVNSAGDAYYLSGGVPRFLARIPDGFVWPRGEDT